MFKRRRDKKERERAALVPAPEPEPTPSPKEIAEARAVRRALARTTLDRPPRTARDMKRGYPNPETRMWRHLCPFCKKGWDSLEEYLRAVCEKSGFPHNSPKHVRHTENFRIQNRGRLR